MTAQSNVKKHTLLLGGVLVLLLALSMVFPIIGCSNRGTEGASNTELEMIDYYSIDSVKAYHRDLQNAITDTVTALQTDDTVHMNTALKELDGLCSDFRAVKDVPDSLKTYHKKMIEVAGYLEAYSADIKANDLGNAAKQIDRASAALKEAKEYLPDSSGNS